MEARQRHLFLDMGNKSLLSVAQFCDTGYRVIFTTDELLIEHKNDPNKSFKDAEITKQECVPSTYCSW